MSKVVKGVKKVFKKIVNSKVFKVVAIAAAVYFGGAALGMWKSGFASVNGAWTAAGSEASRAAALQASGAAATGSTLQAGAGVAAAGQGGLATVAPTASQATMSSLTPQFLGGTAPAVGGAGGAAGGAAAGAGAGAGSSIAGKSMLAASANAAPSVAAPVAQQAVAAAAPKVATKGIISRTMEAGGKTLKGIGTWTKENPFLAQTLVSGISSAASPDEMDQLERKYELEREWENDIRARRDANLQVGNINSRMGTYEQPITWASTGQNVFQNGLISRRVGG